MVGIPSLRSSKIWRSVQRRKRDMSVVVQSGGTSGMMLRVSGVFIFLCALSTRGSSPRAIGKGGHVQKRPQKNTLRRGKNLISSASSQLDVSRHVRPPASVLNRVSKIIRVV